MNKNWFSRLWFGEARLTKAFYEAHLFWLFLFGVYYIYFQPKILARLPITVDQALVYVVIPSIIVINIYNLFTLVAIWRCAFNVKQRMWGYFARLYVLVILGLSITRIINNLGQ